MTVGIILCRVTLDFYVKRRNTFGQMTPEQRLPPVVVGGHFLPVGVFIYGWMLEGQVHWIAPITATDILGLGLTVTNMPTSSYLVDAFGVHAASTIGANVVMHSIAGAILPLAGIRLYKGLGLGWENSVLAFVALAFVPMPLILMRYGRHLRQWEERVIEE